MNYKKIYEDFILDRKNKEVDLIASGEYKEVHHIQPKSLGGSNDKENLIALTAGDHYFAHLCLANVYGGHQWLGVKAMAQLGASNRKLTTSRWWVNNARKLSTSNLKNNHNMSMEIPRAKAIERMKINNPMYNSEVKKRADANRLKKLSSPENRRLNSERQKKYYSSKEMRLEMKRRGALAVITEESNQKRRDKLSGSKNYKSRKVICVELNVIHDCLSEAAKSVGLKASTGITLACQGKRKTAGGYHWEYVDQAA